MSAPELDEIELFEAFEYLDELRDSGRTNMFGAAGYMMDELAWPRTEAVRAVGLWMKTFDGESSLEHRVEKAIELAESVQ